MLSTKHAFLAASLCAITLGLVACGGSPNGNESTGHTSQAVMNTGGGTHVSCQFQPDECGDPFGSQWGGSNPTGGGSSADPGAGGGGAGPVVGTGGDTAACQGTCNNNTLQLCYPACSANPGASQIVAVPGVGDLPTGFISDTTTALSMCLASCNNIESSCDYDCTL
jgi:hypothetical protein